MIGRPDHEGAQAAEEIEKTMKAGTIFVLCLAVGIVIFVAYLAILSRRNRQKDATENGKDQNRK